MMVYLRIFSSREARRKTLFLGFQEKTLHGTFYGGGAALRDYPRVIDLYKQGRLKLTPLITTTYSIEDSDKAYADMAAGRQAGRGVVLFQN